MIIFPDNWEMIGQSIDYIRIQERLISVLKGIGCNGLSLSGGLDSSYMLYCMVQIFGKDVHAYTVTGGEKHPDYIYSKMIAEYFDIEWYPWILPPHDYFDDNLAIQLFYEQLADLGIRRIIACDGIDEYMCGYYAHQNFPDENHYHRLLNDLRGRHLVPLDKNSGGIEVYLPYLDSNLIGLYSQISISEKVDRESRKKVIMNLADGRIPAKILERRKYGFCDAGLQDRKEKGGSE